MFPILYISKERRSKSTSSSKNTMPKPKSPRSLHNTAPRPPLATVSQEILSVMLTESPSSSETNSLSAHNVEPTRQLLVPGHSQQGFAPPSSAFYDTTSPRSSSQTPSSTGATRGANSSAEDFRNANSPLDSMSPSRGESSSNPAQPPTQDTRTSDATRSHTQRPAVRHTTSAPAQQTFPRQAFPTHSFYAPHSGPETFPSHSAYPPSSHAPPGPGYLGQYMSSQPPSSMQPSMGYYSQAFAHPGIHAHDPSAIPLPFPPPLPALNRGYTYAGPSNSDPEARSPSFSSSFSPSGSSRPPVPPSQSQPHHAFPPPPLHFPHAPSPPHYAYPVPHSYAHSSPTIYSYAPNPYSQSFYSQHQPASTEDASKGGTWYYVPPSRGTQYDTSAYPGLYSVQGYQPPLQMNQGDFDHQYPTASSNNAGPTQSGQESSSPPDAQTQLQEPLFPPPTPPALRHTVTSFSATPHKSTSSSQSNSSPTQSKRKVGEMMPSSPMLTSRKSYHPAPPPNRSEWVMWVGNVPSDATHDEVWKFFNQSSPPPPPENASSVLISRLVQPSGSQHDKQWGGVSSVFLISRSNCAFINFVSKSHLESAVAHFNGKPLNPLDPKCPRLVCRIRRKEDDLEAGVGAQRYRGLHTRWVAEQLELERKNRELKDGSKEDFGYFVDAPPTSPSTYLAASSSSSDPSPPIHALSHIEEPFTPPHESPLDGKAKTRAGSLGARSFSSTNSSLLRNYFPKRYFILKSLTLDDLNNSIDRGLWATQPHNEGVLDQAYRTSKDVYLIFSANKSGEFFGYARMAGPIFGENHREEFTPEEQHDNAENSAGRFLTPNESQPLFESPVPTPALNPQLAIDVRRSTDVPVQEVATAPPETYQPHRRLSRPDFVRAVGTFPDQRMVQGSLKSLRTHAPMKGISEDDRVILDKPAARPHDKLAHSTSGVVKRLPGVGHVRSDSYIGGAAADLGVTDKEPPEYQGVDERPDGVDRLKEFNIEWIRTERLSFARTKHLRNPWNNGREVKVSRDGTEIEPNVGQQLLDEWDKPAPQEPPSTTSPPNSPVKSRPSRTTGGAGAGAGSSTFPSSSGRHNRSRPLLERH